MSTMHVDDDINNTPMGTEADNHNAVEVLHSQEKKAHYSKRLVFYCFAMSFGSMSFGFSSAIIATTLGQPSFLEYMNLLPDNPRKPHLMGAINSLFYTGGFFGCLYASWSNDRLGRRATIITAAIIMIISAALCAGLKSHLPMAEACSLKIRAWMAVLAYLVAAYTGIGFYYYRPKSHAEWRAPLALVVVWLLLTLCFAPFLPESPRWPLMKGRSEEAYCIAERLHRSKSDIHGEFARAEFLVMKNQVEWDASLDSSWRSMFTRPSYRHRVFLSASVLFVLYSTGTQVVTNYAPSIYAGLKFSAGASLQFSGGQILVALLAISISLTFVDKIPRNWMLGGGTLATSIPLSIETALTAKFVGTDNSAGLAGGAAFIYLYIFVCTTFLDEPGYFYASELFPTHLRAKGTTICMAFYCLTNILWTQVAPTAFAHIHWKFYLVFVCNAVIFGLCQLLFYHNTLNKPLEEVAAMFGGDDLVALDSQAAADLITTGEKGQSMGDEEKPCKTVDIVESAS